MLVDYDGEEESTAAHRSPKPELLDALHEVKSSFKASKRRKVGSGPSIRHGTEQSQELKSASGDQITRAALALDLFGVSPPNKLSRPNTNTSEFYQPVFQQEKAAAISNQTKAMVPPRKADDHLSIDALLSKRDLSARAVHDVQEFDAGLQYKLNNDARESGDLKEETTVRSIGGGKHQLSSLLNSALSQREALEAQFAKNKDKKRSAGARYGF
ncbi:mitotic checkpoint regulator, MAD2B-interacting-domain-containing protein [Protomyces lactucae-debilis]|uniref:Mitotic checkpoint regulator, MAD2B-interacting-domain-containing protein n=1 Tax=Protomyces lactucae-debilis TaxID=2754530 RepID=A0A1Y2FKJ2_PROLT|nr:mitotic checkpoint regulator, MAD2B-interacting-domain-containing protein [Protomyces lactucae-debilis]ORY84511.1 mitotic checkpoint regulator, MAD2B-interacting-domain-containing protein [Protomyces lactucae-debilis]